MVFNTNKLSKAQYWEVVDCCMLCVCATTAHLTGKEQEINCVVLYYVMPGWNHYSQSPTVTAVTHLHKYFSLTSLTLNQRQEDKKKQTESKIPQ